MTMFGLTLCGMMTFNSQMAKNYKAIPSMQETNTLVVTAEGIIQNATSWQSTYGWTHFQRFVETKSHFFLLSGAYPALWFPKRVITTDDQGSLRNMLLEKLPAKARK